MDLVFFILICYGLTSILVYGKIFENIRPEKKVLKGFFHCPMCIGFHVGWFICLLSPYTEILNFETTLVNLFLCGCISSGTSYILSMVFDDGGLIITLKK